MIIVIVRGSRLSQYGAQAPWETSRWILIVELCIVGSRRMNDADWNGFMAGVELLVTCNQQFVSTPALGAACDCVCGQLCAVSDANG